MSVKINGANRFEQIINVKNIHQSHDEQKRTQKPKDEFFKKLHRAKNIRLTRIYTKNVTDVKNLNFLFSSESFGSSGIHIPAFRCYLFVPNHGTKRISTSIGAIEVFNRCFAVF